MLPSVTVQRRCCGPEPFGLQEVLRQGLEHIRHSCARRLRGTAPRGECGRRPGSEFRPAYTPPDFTGCAIDAQRLARPDRAMAERILDNQIVVLQRLGGRPQPAIARVEDPDFKNGHWSHPSTDGRLVPHIVRGPANSPISRAAVLASRLSSAFWRIRPLAFPTALAPGPAVDRGSDQIEVKAPEAGFALREAAAYKAFETLARTIAEVLCEGQLDKDRKPPLADCTSHRTSG